MNRKELWGVGTASISKFESSSWAVWPDVIIWLQVLRSPYMLIVWLVMANQEKREVKGNVCF